MPRFKLIAMDLDDTLLNDSLEVSARNRRALQIAMNAGARVTIATGRMFRSALPIAESIGIEGPIITYQGAFMKDLCTGEILYEKPVPLKFAREILAEGYKAGVHINLYLNDKLYVDSPTPEGLAYAKLAGVELNTVGNLLEFLEGEPTKLLFIAKPEFVDRIQQKMRRIFGENIYITKSKPNYLEFMHPQATKGGALKFLADKWGIQPEEVLAFGDSFNDLDMIKFAGLGVAMGNAPEEIKKRADYVSASNNHDGVAEVIERFFK